MRTRIVLPPASAHGGADDADEAWLGETAVRGTSRCPAPARQPRGIGIALGTAALTRQQDDGKIGPCAAARRASRRGCADRRS